MKNILLVDGASLLVSNFFATAGQLWRTDKEKAKQYLMQHEGQYTNGVFSATKVLLKILKNHSFDGVAIAWDISRKTFRSEAYPAYKANRDETDPIISSQFPIAKEVFAAMGIAQFEMDGFEGDDIIGTLSSHFSEQEDARIYILTKDRDMLQLVKNNVSVWLDTSKASSMFKEFYDVDIMDLLLEMDTHVLLPPEGYFNHTPATVEYFYGVPPEQFVYTKAIIGDTSDNIPGAKGVGEKAVIPLIQEFGSIQSVYDYLDSVEEKEAKVFFKSIGISRSPYKLLLEHREAVVISEFLSRIKLDIPDFLIDVHQVDFALNQAGAEAVFEKYQFNSLVATLKTSVESGEKAEPAKETVTKEKKEKTGPQLRVIEGGLFDEASSRMGQMRLF